MAPSRPRVVRCAEHEFIQHDLSLINETEIKSRSAEETQKWLAEESEKALKYHLALNAYRNNLSPIHQLPNELLATVFALIAESCDQPAVGVHLSHVCRRWRSVALQLPVLWVTIDVDNLKRATAFLERSKNYPITIYWGPRPSPLNPLSDDMTKSKKCEAHEGLYDDLVRILPDHVKRIQKLCIKRQLAEDVTCFFQEIYGGPFTSLKEIIIDTKHPILLPSEEDYDPPVDAFRYEEAPKLTTVMLRGVHLTNWDENMFSGLRVLKLHDMDRGSLISFDTFMKGLKACPDLEELELHAAGINPLSLVRDTGPAIALPRLRLLDLCLDVALTKHLLLRIIVPESAMVKVKCYTARQITTDLSTSLPSYSSKGLRTKLGLPRRNECSHWTSQPL
ncbi:hypothetical protein K474DRAFT_328406 [Panus rudis PR-1116 ss-1]|nr:hypothetical protein K474DRAFT_328406 [Panus rudis PR-1116 ss-1]